MISGNRDEAWPMYLVWPISERFVLGLSGGTWPACCHWPNTGRVDARCPIMSVLTQSYQCGTWFVCSILRELAVSILGQPLFCLSITWSRCRNAYRDLWIMTIDERWFAIYRILASIYSMGMCATPSCCADLTRSNFTVLWNQLLTVLAYYGFIAECILIVSIEPKFCNWYIYIYILVLMLWCHWVTAQWTMYVISHLFLFVYIIQVYDFIISWPYVFVADVRCQKWQE